MIHTDLAKIPLSRFIDLFLGDIDKVVINGRHSVNEKREAAEKLCSEYLTIVGGKSATAQISRQNEIIKIQMRMNCFDICDTLIANDEFEEAGNIMEALGYKFKAGEEEKMKNRMASISATDRYRLAKLVESVSSVGKKQMNRDYFTRERVSVMSHVKMHIDENKFSAREYAYMVRGMCDEIDAMIRSTKKK